MTERTKDHTQQKRIRQLPTLLANQIAAGEVIERPASVLKELLENSLDAGSTQIEISIERGGSGLIRVQDNGSGICKEDLKLAIAPHATSKIASLLDLEGVLSYGFRGEALASIASVSRLTLSACTEEQELGWSVRLEGRDGSPILKPVPKRVGTVVEVRDLFYNTPARRKFLRSEKTELTYLEEVFKRVALCQPNVVFKFKQNERVEKRFPACKTLDAHARRVGSLCSLQFAEDAYFIEAKANGLKCWGWLGSRKALRSQADLQYFYVNGRIVRDKVVMHAVRQAYQEICLPGRYPAYVLFLECDPKAVDVNVHPTKHEVRFREARTVHAFITYAVQEGLNKGSAAIPVQSDSAPPSASDPFSFKINPMAEESPINITSPIWVEDALPSEKVPFSFLEMGSHTIAKNRFEVSKPDALKTSDKIFSVFADALVLVEDKGAEKVLLIDVKATRRILLQTSLTEAYHQQGIAKKPLVMPKSVAVGKGVENLEFSLIQWDALGFELSQASENTVWVRAVPAEFGGKLEELSSFIPKLLACVNLEACIDLMIETVLETQSLSEAEIKQLLVKIEKGDIPEKKGTSRLYRKFTLSEWRSALLSG